MTRCAAEKCPNEATRKFQVYMPPTVDGVEVPEADRAKTLEVCEDHYKALSAGGGSFSMGASVDHLTPETIADDPRSLGGNIAAGSPHGIGDSVIDTRNAMLFDQFDVAVAHDSQSGDLFCLQFEGRVAHDVQRKRTRVLLMCNEDGLAAVITELEAMLGRIRASKLSELADRVEEACKERWETLTAEGVVGEPRDTPP